MKVTTTGIDLAKIIFQVRGIDGHGRVVLGKQRKPGSVPTKIITIYEPDPDEWIDHRKRR